MKGRLMEVLQTFGHPVMLQGSLAPDGAYPDAFWTFWAYDAPESHYDNSPCACRWGFWVYFYGIDPDEVESKPLEAKRALEKAGFSVAGKPVDAASDRKTHTGAMLDVRIIERYESEE